MSRAKLGIPLSEVLQLLGPDAFAKNCPDGQKCGATTTGCRVGNCQRIYCQCDEVHDRLADFYRCPACGKII